MNKILFVIHSLGAGGAEKSLISLLNVLPKDNLKIDLMILNASGMFLNQIPDSVNVISTPKELIQLMAKLNSSLFLKTFSMKTFLVKLYCIFAHKFFNKHKSYSLSQHYWHIAHRIIPKLSNKYDTAISYMDGYCNWYVIEKVDAKKKLLWIHNDYNKYNYDSSFDLSFFEKANKVITISEKCKQSLIDKFPTLIDRFDIIENILSPNIIRKQSEFYNEMLSANDGFYVDKKFKILSIGRLMEQKGFDMAIDAAKILKDYELDFCWYILGDGPLRKELELHADKTGVSKYIKFIGLRSNPYAYIKKADLYVMPSRYEGKSIALDEAKILCKPIVVTKYPSVYDAIKDKENGYLVEINSESIANGILELYNNISLREKLCANLYNEDNSNVNIVVNNFLKLIL